jgi:hypothetical protein
MIDWISALFIKKRAYRNAIEKTDTRFRPQIPIPLNHCVTLRSKMKNRLRNHET